MKKVFCIMDTNIGVAPERAHIPPCLKGHHYTVLEEKERERKEYDDGHHTTAGIWYSMVELGPKWIYHSSCFIDVKDEVPDMDEIVKPHNIIKLEK